MKRYSGTNTFCNKSVFRIFEKLARKQLYRVFFLIKLHFIKKETLAPVLSCEFCEILKNTFLIEQLWVTASAQRMKSASILSNLRQFFFETKKLARSCGINFLSNKHWLIPEAATQRCY